MRRSISVVVTALIGSLVLAVPALADQAGTGSVRAPRVVQSYHVAFTLPGDSWSQIRDPMGGGVELGQYAFAPGSVPPTTIDGRVCVEVFADLQHKKPTIVGRELTIKPGLSTDRVRITSHGSTGVLHWWTGRESEGNIPVAVGYRRAPRSLDPTGARWLVFLVTTDRTGPTVSTDHAKAKLAAGVVATVAKTMHLATGAPTKAPPYAGA